MSFQGDVAGLGLGELLQGLARGGREGVLTLRGGGLSTRLGVQEGQLLLLPEEDEDPEIWRKRCERAWVTDPDQRIDVLRMGEIAYAARLETMFRLLDCEGVHFRFEPGPLPDLTIPIERAQKPSHEEPLVRMETGATVEVRTHVTCPPVSVEFILLEYARLCDELGAHPQASALSDHFIPRPLGQSPPHRSFQRLWTECDGNSNVTEISDRLGWPVRQVRGSLVDLFQKGVLRFADAREQLALASRELAAGRFARAASRLAGWCQISAPGPIEPGDLQLLIAEWERGKLPVALASMSGGDARTLLRRIDAAHPHPTSAIARWNELRKHHRHDGISELRCLHWQHRSDLEADFPAMTDLLRVARKFQELGHPWRAGIVLRAAASRGPETTSVRMEIGQRLCSVGLVDEGAAWVVEACRAMILAGTPDRAIGPLRQLLQVSPAQREAKALLAVAHGKTVSGKRTRRNSVVVLAGVLMVSILAVVKVRSDQSYSTRFAEVTDRLGDPVAALATLEQHFEGSTDEAVVALRQQLTERIKTRQLNDRSDWIARFQECQLECTGGDPVLGLRNALELPAAPPAPEGSTETLPKLADLLGGLLARLEQTVAEWSDPSVDGTEAAHAEVRLERLINDLRDVIDPSKESRELIDFRSKLDSLILTLGERSEMRAAEREKRTKAQNVQRLDALLGAARAHDIAGDLERSVAAYDELIRADDAGGIQNVLREEIGRVKEHLSAVNEARELALAGDHVRALERLSLACANPMEHLLPCRIESSPSGARVRFNDGTTRTTPFVFEAAPGERVKLEFEFEGCEKVALELRNPGDQMVLLSRTPTAWWKTDARVEAVPVSIDEDHIVCDRNARVARLSPRGELLWSETLTSLGGVARTPVFMAKRAGSLLVITEDGQGEAWVIDGATGHTDGPYKFASPVLSGPEPTSAGVRVRLRDGREILWTSRVTPESEAMVAEVGAPNRGHDAGMVLIRRSANEATSLTSPWAQIEVSVEPTHFVVRSRESKQVLFAVGRDDEWNFVAWEAPKARSPSGKLWISDGAGLRAYDL